VTQPIPTPPDDIQAGLAEITRLTAANDATLNAMRQQGAVVGQETIIAQRLFTLLDRILGPAEGEHATVERLTYEADFHHRLAGLLEAAQTQLRHAKLLQGVQLNGHTKSTRAN
jgi:hypothetical protein